MSCGARPQALLKRASRRSRTLIGAYGSLTGLFSDDVVSVQLYVVDIRWRCGRPRL